MLSMLSSSFKNKSRYISTFYRNCMVYLLDLSKSYVFNNLKGCILFLKCSGNNPRNN